MVLNLIISSNWNNESIIKAGSVIWANKDIGITGTISSANSLIGSSINDQVGFDAIALTNGNYVVIRPNWDDPYGPTVEDVGAVTWGNGTTGITRVVSSSNSLVGTTDADQVGSNILTLSNGNYLILSSSWDREGIANVRAVTWADGTKPITGTINEINSLIGSSTNDLEGATLPIEISNANYIVPNTSWHNGALASVGAVTFCNETNGTSGEINSSNSITGRQDHSSLVGTPIEDQVNNSIYIVFKNENAGAGRVTVAYLSPPPYHFAVKCLDNYILSMNI